MDAQISQTLSVNALASLVDVVDSAEANKTFYKKKSEKPGVIVYYTDGYENVTTDNFTSNNLSVYMRHFQYYNLYKCDLLLSAAPLPPENANTAYTPYAAPEMLP